MRLKDNHIQIAPTAYIHETARIASYGIKLQKLSIGKLQGFRHEGGVKIADWVEIGPFCSISVGTQKGRYTILREGVKLGHACHIGHHSDIGPWTIMVTGVAIEGSVKIGRNCFIGSNSVVISGKIICDNVRIGAGSVVTRDIDRPGIWFGSPAKFQREWTDEYDGKIYANVWYHPNSFDGLKKFG